MVSTFLRFNDEEINSYVGIVWSSTAAFYSGLIKSAALSTWPIRTKVLHCGSNGFVLPTDVVAVNTAAAIVAGGVSAIVICVPIS